MKRISGRTESPHRRLRAGFWAVGVAAAVLGGALIAAAASPHPSSSAPVVLPSPTLAAQLINLNPPGDPLAKLTDKQKRALLKERYQKAKRQAAELVELAETLQKEIDKASPDVMSVQVIKKAEKIEKLAKKIKNEARGY